MLRDLQLDMAKKEPLDDLLYSNYKKYSTRKSKINNTSNIREHPLDEHLKRNLVGQEKGAEIIWKEKTENKGNYIQKSHPPAMNEHFPARVEGQHYHTGLQQTAEAILNSEAKGLELPS